MTISGLGRASNAAVMAQMLVDMRGTLADLQRQMSTGKKSDSYAGLGGDRGLTVRLRQDMAQIESRSDTMKIVGIRLEVAQSALGRIETLGRDTVHALSSQALNLDQTGQSDAQRAAKAALDEALSLLNSRAGDRYLFSGRAQDAPAVVTSDLVLNGDATRAGLKQLINERRQADVGTGTGRLLISGVGSAVSLAEEAAGLPFGLKLAASSSNLTGVAVSGPGGAPPSIGMTVSGTPLPGEFMNIAINLPDGTQRSIQLRATASATPGKGEFSIGGSTAATAANLQQSLSDAVTELASGALIGASAMKAAAQFFAADANNPPLRVQGPPFNTAMTEAAGSANDTVIWYTGESGADPARATALARVDESVTVAYGMRANEPAFRRLLEGVGVLAATSFTPGSPDSSRQYAALAERATAVLDGPPGVQQVSAIAADIAGAQSSMAAAKNRQATAANVIRAMLDTIENVAPEEAATRILALQTRLQASLQTTAMLSRISLVNYL